MRHRLGIWLTFALAVLSVWGHYQEVGAASPQRPQDLVLTSTWSVCGWQPYLQHDAAGWAPRWLGLALGAALTGLLYAAARHLDRRYGRQG